MKQRESNNNDLDRKLSGVSKNQILKGDKISNKSSINNINMSERSNIKKEINSILNSSKSKNYDPKANSVSKQSEINLDKYRSLEKSYSSKSNIYVNNPINKSIEKNSLKSNNKVSNSIRSKIDNFNSDKKYENIDRNSNANKSEYDKENLDDKFSITNSQKYSEIIKDSQNRNSINFEKNISFQNEKDSILEEKEENLIGLKTEYHKDMQKDIKNIEDDNIMSFNNI